MQTITLNKSSHSHVFSHVYEHVYCIALDTLLRESGLVPIIDYDIHATTESGVIRIELESYTDAGLGNYVERINADDTIVEEHADTAVGQVEAEKRLSLTIQDAQIFYHQLNDFHRLPWGSPSSVLGDSLYEGAGLKPMLCKIGTPYPPLETELLPLYRLVVGVILNAVANDLADSYAGFIQSRAFAVNELDELEMLIALHPDVDVSDLEDVARSAFTELLDSDSLVGLLNELQDVAAMECPPSNTFSYKDLIIEMDSDAWRQVATADNLEKVKKAAHISVELMMH